MLDLLPHCYQVGLAWLPLLSCHLAPFVISPLTLAHPAIAITHACRKLSKLLRCRKHPRGDPVRHPGRGGRLRHKRGDRPQHLLHLAPEQVCASCERYCAPAGSTGTGGSGGAAMVR